MSNAPWSAVWIAAPGRLAALLFVATGLQYLCVPETDHLTTMAAMCVGLAVVEILTSRAYALSRLAAALAVVWAGWFGAVGRSSAEVGALVSFWPLIATALVSATHRRHNELSTSVAGFVIVACTAASSAVARTGALAPQIGPALRSTALWVSLSALASLGALLIGRLHYRGRSAAGSLGTS